MAVSKDFGLSLIQARNSQSLVVLQFGVTCVRREPIRDLCHSAVVRHKDLLRRKPPRSRYLSPNVFGKTNAFVRVATCLAIAKAQ